MKRIQQRHGRRGLQLCRRLVAPMAVGTPRIVVRPIVIPVTDDTRDEYQQRGQR